MQHKYIYNWTKQLKCWNKIWMNQMNNLVVAGIKDEHSVTVSITTFCSVLPSTFQHEIG